MTAPVLYKKKFWIVKPWGGENQIKNPRFDMPDGKEDWAASGAGVTIANSSDEQRFGAYSMKVNTANNVASTAYYAGLSVVTGLSYTFSCYVKGVAGQAMRVFISNVGNTIKGTTQFTATGYWQRVQVTVTADDTKTDWYAAVSRDATASTAAYYVDGAQFEWAGSATTLMSGYTKGCRWTGAVRNSSSIRDHNSTEGGWIVDLESYCHVVQAVGLGHGDWNQIMTKMTSGGDMYQTHIRKSRQFSLIVDFLGNSLGEIEANRKAVIDLIRPDAFEGQERIIRYQGVDVNGVEATNPIDIRCVPLPATLTDTPDLPSYQRGILNFAIPSGLLNGAYHEGSMLDFYADFPAEFIVKRDPQGNWCKWTGSAYASLITGLNEFVACMAEGPDGKIYVGGAFTNAGGVSGASRLARWNPTSEAWESVVAGIDEPVYALVFDANGDLYVGGDFSNLGGPSGDRIVKITDLSGTPTVNNLGTGITGMLEGVKSIAVSPNGDVYIGGSFSSVGGVTNTVGVAKWNGTTWSALATGISGICYDLKFAPNGDLYIGGDFTNVTPESDGDYICYWDGTRFNKVGTVELNNLVYTLAFSEAGWLYVGGTFTNAGGIASADYIAKWTGSKWEPLGTGTNNTVYNITVSDPNQSANGNLSGGMTVGKVYVSGLFTTAGGMTLPDRVAVWSNGAWQPLDINLPGTASVRSILPASDGSLYVGGDFTTAGTAGTPKATCGIVSDRVYTLGVASASANTYPYIQISGPGTLKSITNWITGKSLMFDGLTLQTGETISLNLDPLNLQFKSSWAGRGNVMRYVVAGSDYGDFHMRPGSNTLSFYMTGNTPASFASIVWQPLFWGLDGALL